MRNLNIRQFICLCILLPFATMALDMNAQEMQVPKVPEMINSLNFSANQMDMPLVKESNGSESLKDGAAIQEIYYENFSNGIPSSWTNQGYYPNGQPYPEANWEYRGLNTSPDNSTGSRGAYADPALTIQSPTVGDGFVIFDSDYLDNDGIQGNFGNGEAPAPHVGTLTTSDFDLSSYPNVVLSFNSFHRYFEGRSLVALSTDGGSTWMDTIEVHDLAVNSANEMDDRVSFDISSAVGGSSNVKIRFIFDGSYDDPAATGSGQGYYYWMIDDVRLIEKPKNELQITDFALSSVDPSGFTVSYGQIPLEQDPEVYSASILWNSGQYDQTNVGTRLYSYGPVNNSNTSAQQTLTANSVILTNNNINLSTAPDGTYQFAISAVSDSAKDADPRNLRPDLDSFYSPNSTEINQEVYAVDNGYATNEKGTEYAGGDAQDGARFANALFIKNPDTLTAVRIYIGSETVPGGHLFIEVKDTTPTFGTAFDANAGGDWTNTVLKSDPYQITATDTANGYVEIRIPQQLSGGALQDRVLAPDMYYVSVSMFSNAGANPITILDDELSNQGPFSSIYYYYPNGRWFSDGNAMWIRAIFGYDICSDVHVNISAEICDGETYEVGNQSFSTSGNHSASIALPEGCDSIVNLDLTVHQNYNINLQESICEGDSFLFAGQYYSAGGNYNLDTSSVKGCDSTVNLNLAVISIDTQLTVNSDTMKVSPSADSVKWYDCNDNKVLITTLSTTIVAPSTGNYKAILYKDGCEFETSCKPVTVIGIDDPEMAGIKLWPNPTKGLLNVQINEMMSVEHIEVVNINGQVIRKTQPQSKSVVLDISDLSNGVYMVRIKSANEKPVNLRFVKQ